MINKQGCEGDASSGSIRILTSRSDVSGLTN